MEKLYDVKLSYEELILLDGKCNDKIQEVINEAKEIKKIGLDDFCNEVIADSLKTGKLTWSIVKISSCKYCDNKPFGYYKYQRNSRNHRKGDNDYDHPIRYMGVIPNPGFIILEGASGICRECWEKKYLPKIIKYIDDNNLNIKIPTLKR